MIILYCGEQDDTSDSYCAKLGLHFRTQRQRGVTVKSGHILRTFQVLSLR